MKKLLITIMALTLTLIMSVSMVGCSVFEKAPADETPTTETTETTGTSTSTASTSSKKNEVQRVAMAFSAGVTVDATETEPAHVTKRLEAVVEPVTAPQEVDYTVAWQEGASLASEDVSTYLKVEQDSDGSLGATVKCYKAFGSDTIVITCTTRSRQKQDVCLVTFEGVTYDVVLEHSFELKSTEEIGEYYEFIYQYYTNKPNFWGEEVTEKGLLLPITASSIFGDGFGRTQLFNEVEVSATVKGNTKIYEVYQISLVDGEYVVDVRLRDMSELGYDLTNAESYKEPTVDLHYRNFNMIKIVPDAYANIFPNDYYTSDTSDGYWQYCEGDQAYLSIDKDLVMFNDCKYIITNGEEDFTSGVFREYTTVQVKTSSGAGTNATVTSEFIEITKAIIHNEDGTTEERDASYIANYNEEKIANYAYIELQLYNKVDKNFSKKIKFKLLHPEQIVSNVTLPENIVI